MDKNRFVTIVLIIQILLSIFILLGINYLGILSFIQFFYFINLIVLPGYMFIKILNLKELDNLEVILCSIGISIFLIMFIGFLMNLFYPFIGLIKPISTIPIISTFTALYIFLCSVLYLKTNEGEKYLEFNFKSFLHYINWKFFFILFIPILAIFGALVNYFYNNDIILIFMLLYIVLTVILIGFNKISKEYYTMAVLAISIALVLHTSISIFQSLYGTDIWQEYYTQVLVVQNNIWNTQFNTYLNSVVSITILGPFIHFITNLSLFWILKIIYPLIFSLVPLILFKSYKKFTSDKISFLAVFLFMSLSLFFNEMLQLGRQEIAEFFLALLILLFSLQYRNYKTASLIVPFTIALIISHYSLSYIFLIYIIIALIIIAFLRKYNVKFLVDKVNGSREHLGFINFNFVLFAFIACIGYYFYVDGGNLFDLVTGMGHNMIYSISNELFSYGSGDTQVLQAVGAAPLIFSDFSWQFARVSQIIVEFLIAIGILELIYNLKKKKSIFNEEFTAFSLTSIFILIICVVLPYFANTINAGRFFQISLFFLSPFCIMGGLFIIGFLRNRILNRSFKLNKDYLEKGIKILIIFVLVPYFLVNTGLLFAVTNSTPSSPALSLNQAYWPFFDSAEYNASYWYSKNANTSDAIYVDIWTLGLQRYFGLANTPDFPPDWNLMPGSYVFLGKWNIKHNQMYVNVAGPNNNSEGIISITGKVNDTFEDCDKIYDSGDANILFHE